MTGPDVVRIRGWERFGWLRAGFSTRAGGVSTAFGGESLNLGWNSEDQDDRVAENRRRVARAILEPGAGADEPKLVTMRQVHSDAVQAVREWDPSLATADGRATLEGDALVTGAVGLVLGIQVADCVPVLIADVSRRIVAAVHAGWRGTLDGIVERAVGVMRDEYGSAPEDMVAAIGPSIGPCCYAVSDDLRTTFESRFPYGTELFHGSSDASGAQPRLDLWEANRRQLLGAGISAHGLSVLGECTACTLDEAGELKYFSHRAERGRAGRMMGLIGVVRSQS